MKRVGFKMKLIKGFEDEYKKRHDEIWPELVNLLKDTGISDYSIFLDEDTGILFGNFKIENDALINALAGHPVMKKWWLHMKDIMETNLDHSPVSTPLKEVFYMQ